jgi:AcrR family transcriptional regulator
MGSAERRERQRKEVRNLILSAARELIREEGYERLTIRSIAERIEYSPMALYNHFPDKSAILAALADAGFAELLKKVPRFAGLPPLEALRRGMLAYIEFGLKNPEDYRMVFMTQRRHGSEADLPRQGDMDSLSLEHGREAFKMLTELTQRCAAEDARFQNVFEVSSLLWAGLHGVTSLLITLPDFPFGPAQQYSENMVNLLLDGITEGRPPRRAGKSRRQDT